MANQRKVALYALLAVGEDYGYSNLVLQKALSKADVEKHDKPFITALFYGVLDRIITLDYVISRFITKPIEKIAPITLFSLRLAVYQILYMEKVPDSAAVNESVKLVKFSKEKYNASFVNAVLRNFLRNGIKIPDDNSVDSLKIRYSCPEWIIKSLIDDYGLQNTVSILAHYLTVPNITVRINSPKVSDNDFVLRLKENSIEVSLLDIPHSAVLNGGVDVKSLNEYNEGLFYVQDLPSQIAVSKLDIKDGESVLDLCAAPGGKSFLAAQSGYNSHITSCDYLESRVNLVTNGAKRLGLNNIDCIVRDSRVFDKKLGLFDCVICDVPCSGLGVIRRKPEIKYKTDLDFKELEKTQAVILENGLKYLKKGGRLLYSTCTLRRAENEIIVRACLDKQNNFKLEYEHTFLPDIDKTDGFYFAIIKSR